MKIAFKIPPQNEIPGNLQMIAEAGNDEISFLIFEKNPFSICGFYTYNFDSDLSPDALASRFREILQSEKILLELAPHAKLFYNFKDAVLSDSIAADEKEEHCNRFFGKDSRQKCCSAVLQHADVALLYRLPLQAKKVLRNAMPAQKPVHSLTCIKPPRGGGGTAECHIYHSTIRVLLWENGKLLFGGYFDYTSPEDVLYHLISTYATAGKSIESTALVLSGMIALSSGLMRTLEKYFPEISFSTAADAAVFAGRTADHPPHYYAHLAELAQCG